MVKEMTSDRLHGRWVGSQVGFKINGLEFFVEHWAYKAKVTRNSKAKRRKRQLVGRKR